MKGSSAVLRIVLVGLILGAGVGMLVLLGALRKAPTQVTQPEVVVRAEAMRVAPGTVRTMLTGYGTARAHRRATIGAEVGGRVVEVSERFEEGFWVQAGETILQIDPRDYEAMRDQRAAEVKNLELQIRLLKQEQADAAERLELKEKAYELGERDLARTRKLVQMEGVEPISRLEAAERVLTRDREELVMLRQSVARYPLQIEQTEARLRQARAQLEVAELNVERSSVAAPFAGRVDMKRVEAGQQVSPGEALFELIDDSKIEVSVPIEGVQVARWLDVELPGAGEPWFADVPAVPVEVTWTEMNEAVGWKGRLERVARYDERTRTVDLVVQVDKGTSAAMGSGNPGHGPGTPLMDGMFCSVRIPGRVLKGVYELPRSALSPDGTVLTVVDGRMRSAGVEVVRYEGDTVVIGAGLSEGDLVLLREPGLVVEGVKVDASVIEPSIETRAEAGAGDASVGLENER